MPIRDRRLNDDELEMMKVIWEREPVPARELHRSLQQNGRPSYTAVLTMLAALEDKGYVARQPGDDAYLYRASRPRAEVAAELADDLVRRVFDGSARPLLTHLLDRGHLTPRDLEQALESRSEPTC